MSAASTVFNTLPKSVQRRIDRAFDTALSRSASRTSGGGFVVSPAAASSGGGFELPSSSTSGGGFVVEPAGESGGGFIVEDNESVGGGGFIPDSPPSTSSSLPFNAISTGLQLLDIEEDEDVLNVFRNAASNWGEGDNVTDMEEEREEGTVRKEDWRAVCAILLEGQAMDDGGEEDDYENEQEQEDYEQEDEQEEEDEDMYEDEADDSEDEEYAPHASTSTSHRRTRTRARSSSSSSSNIETTTLSSSQKSSILQTYSLFFPSSPHPSTERIGIKDLQRLFALLNLESKVKANELVEMLDAFSTANDKTMGLKDFERMMITAKLV